MENYGKSINLLGIKGKSLLKTKFFKEKKHKKLRDNVVLKLSKYETVLNYIQIVLFLVFFILIIILIIRN